MTFHSNSKHFLFSTLIIFVIIFSSKLIFAQGKIVEGYIVSPANDTIKGFIRYAGWAKNPATIHFASEKTGPFRLLSYKDLIEFYLPAMHEKYKMRKIGLININNTEAYLIPPSLIPADSLNIFLREITDGPKASLLEYVNSSGIAHYFLEKDGILTELIYYSFRRIIRGQERLLTYNDYKNQLPKLLSDSEKLPQEIPKYVQKSLQNYVEKYNESFGNKKYSTASKAQSNHTFDLTFNGGIESWREENIAMTNELTYGIGIRINMPRKFHNRYYRVNFFMIPGILAREIYPTRASDKLNLKTLELGLGTHFGYGAIRPSIGIDYSIPVSRWRTALFGPHFGISYRRQLGIEISHLINFNSAFSKVPFTNRPRVSVNYYLNLNKLFVKTQ